MIAKLWLYLSPYQAQIIAFLLTTLTTIIGRLLTAKVKLIWGSANNSYHSVNPGNNQPAIGIYCEKFYVQNIGRKPANNVEIVFSNVPDEISMYPPANYTRTVTPTGNLVIGLNYATPGHLLIFDTIHINKQAARILSVQCPDAIGKQVPFWVLRQYPQWWYNLLGLLVLLGLFFVFQILIKGVSALFGDGSL